MRSNQTLILVTNNYAPIKKMTVKTVKSPCIDDKEKNGMVQREEARGKRYGKYSAF
jgi:hypothetical protein